MLSREKMMRYIGIANSGERDAHFIHYFEEFDTVSGAEFRMLEHENPAQSVLNNSVLRPRRKAL
jgi:hypothetical protein